MPHVTLWPQGRVLQRLPVLADQVESIALIWTLVERHDEDSDFAPFWRSLPQQLNTGGWVGGWVGYVHLVTLRSTYVHLVTLCCHLCEMPGHTGSLWVTLGHTWSLLATLGHSWPLLVTLGHSWSLLVTPGPPWSLKTMSRHKFQFPSPARL